MSRALRTIGVIAAAAALIATGVGAAAGVAAAAKGASAAAVASATKIAATAAVVSKAATVVAIGASVGAQITAPRPVARGSPATVVIDVEPPRPYIVGQVMTGGVLRYDSAYGATLNRVPNPFRWQVRVLSGVGPVQAIDAGYFDFQPVSSFYTGFFTTVQQLGARPESAALSPPFGAAPGWDSASKLSGCAAVGLNFKFDRDGERFAAGLPLWTAEVQGELVYDPRQDSSYPGGSGACRLGNEATYIYSRNPALHAATYAYGRFQDGKRLFGLAVPGDAIDWPAVVDWANDCDTNGWTANLILYEGGTGANLREQRVRNLDDLCAAGGARWFHAGAQLSFDWHRPRVSLATLTDADILEAGGGTDAVQTVRDRMNGVRPQYISPAHNWQQITGAEIVGSTYRTEDGGKALTQIYPLNGVTDAVQAGQLAAYFMADSRELGPMDVQATAAWRFYRPGDCITIDSSLMAYQGQAVINSRGLDPGSLAVALSLKSETPGKHPFALGKVATPPPTPLLAQTAEERDLLASAALRPRAVDAAQGATRNEDGGGNLIAAPGDPATWSFIAGGQASDAVAAVLNGTAAQLQAPGDGVKWGRFRVTPGEWLAYRHVATCDAGVPSGASVSGGFNFFDRTGALLAPPDDAEDAAGAAISQAQAFNVAFRAEGEALVPAGAAFAEPYAIRTGGGGGSFYVNQARAGRSALGATRGAPAGTPVAGQDAAALVADAATAKADAASALSTLSFIADDSYLSRDEKPEVRKQRDIIIAEYPGIAARAATYSVASAAVYGTAYTNLIAYLDVLDLGAATDTFIVRSVFNFRFVEYFDQRQAVLDEIAAIINGQTQLLDAGNGRAVTRRLVPQIIGSGVIQIVDTNPLSATTDGSGVATISIAAHVVSDDGGTVSFSSASIGGLAASDGYYVYEINPNYAGGARTYSATTDRTVLATPGARFVGYIITPAAGGSSSGSGAGAGFQTPGNPEWEP